MKTATATLTAAAMMFTAPAMALAENEPSPEEIHRVLDYFNSGKGRGPILTGFRACVAVDTRKDSSTRFECTEEAAGTVKKGTLLHAWTAWFVPQGDSYDDVVVQFLHEGSLRSTHDLSVSGAFRTRSFKSQTLSKSGTWEIKVVRAEKVLASSKIVVE
ncbi:MAG: hypothetical protein HY901_10750 [Deltaproteobacteria bacterium]|nr:hypothetical protein [Deltaproteobacteria bacterium]